MMRGKSVKTITIASAKGGSGKSTITSTLAVRACQDTKQVAMMDLNFDQGSLSHWWHLRGEPASPGLAVNVEDIPRDVRTLARGYDWLFIDTPPLDMDIIEQAVAVADAVVVPVRPGLFDVLTVQSVLEMARQHRKPFAFLLNAVDSRFKKVTEQTTAAIEELGPIFPTKVSCRQPYIQALVIGKTGPEFERDLRPEIDSLWSEVKRLAETGRVQ